jgi:hypothetical protein
MFSNLWIFTRVKKNWVLCRTWHIWLWWRGELVCIRETLDIYCIFCFFSFEAQRQIQPDKPLTTMVVNLLSPTKKSCMLWSQYKTHFLPCLLHDLFISIGIYQIGKICMNYQDNLSISWVIRRGWRGVRYSGNCMCTL